ncbi:ribonuclease H [Trifolium pratense]|uniref:Ribonuclease H n=1 Tax=Trifolium pratense TaxID=57577 RepID=A0A2K3NQL0_TRIPR|nr:ribonuclease H [Trifolium pratense]
MEGTGGPDGFPAGFYQHSWDTVGQSVCDFVKNIWKAPSGIAMVNQTDICLIPKVDQPEFASKGYQSRKPYIPLFVLCMDKLSHLICHDVDEGLWKTMHAGRNDPLVSHLMFADDLLLFGEANERQMKCVMEILNKFCKISGQEVSNEKISILFSKNVDRNIRRIGATVWFS